MQALKCKPSALKDSDLALVEELKSMDEVMSRPTPDAQKELLDRIREAQTSEIDESIEEEFKVG